MSTAPYQPGKYEELTGVQLHMSIAEQGKMYALAGNHKLALHYYRTAMNLSVQAKEPEVFFRHYLECSLESMELLELYIEVLHYCDKALKIYEENPPPHAFARKDRAYIHQRKGIVLLKLGHREEAQKHLQHALDQIKQEGEPMPLAEKLLRWVQTGMHLDPHRILAEQKRERYFSVRKDQVDPSKAVKLPDEDALPF